jgi:hypothetical protein
MQLRDLLEAESDATAWEMIEDEDDDEYEDDWRCEPSIGPPIQFALRQNRLYPYRE